MKDKKDKDNHTPFIKRAVLPYNEEATMAAPKNYMIWSFELLLGNYVNSYMEDSHFPQHNQPLAHSLYVFGNMVGMVK